MNLRLTFFWNALIGISVILILYVSYKYYGIYSENQDNWKKYNSEEFGTDTALENIINEMETNFLDRSKFKFKMKKDNPTDLSRVIKIDGMENFYGLGTRGIRVAGIRTINHSSSYKALVQFKENFRWVVEGDTIGGGKITLIDRTNLRFIKDGDEYLYDLSNK